MFTLNIPLILFALLFILTFRFSMNRGRYWLSVCLIGVVGTIIGWVNMLVVLENPDNLYQMTGQSLLCFPYTVLTAYLLSPFVDRIVLAPTIRMFIQGACVFLTITEFSHFQNTLAFIDIPTVVFFVVFYGGSLYVNPKTVTAIEKLKVLGICTLFWTTLHLSQLISNWNDPSLIGPGIASILLGLLYGSLLSLVVLQSNPRNAFY